MCNFGGNGGFCGGGFFAAPEAELYDGFLDFCFIRDIPRLRFLSLVGPYKKGTHLTLEDRDELFEYGKCREVELFFDEPKRICIDGEIEFSSHIHLQIEKQAIALVIPGYTEKVEASEATSVVGA